MPADLFIPFNAQNQLQTSELLCLESFTATSSTLVERCDMPNFDVKYLCTVCASKLYAGEFVLTKGKVHSKEDCDMR